MINDISAFRDPDMMNVVKKFDVPVIIMHMKGEPCNMQNNPSYDNVIKDILSFLIEAVDKAISNGIDRSKIIIDPGIGFGKTIEHNYSLINNLKQFCDINVPILIGPSRKSFLRKSISEMLSREPELSEIEVSTQAAIAACAMNGANIIRVHDVSKTRITLKIIDTLTYA